MCALCCCLHVQYCSLALVAKMVAATSIETCANPTLREHLEPIRLLAKLQEVIDRLHPSISWLVSFILGFLTAVLMNVFWLLLLTKPFEIFKLSRAAQRICRYVIRPAGADLSVADKTEAALALASDGVREATAADSTTLQEEVNVRQWLRNDWLNPLFRVRHKGDTLPVTISCSTGPASTSSCRDTSNVPFPISVHLPDKTIEADQTTTFQSRAANHLSPAHTQELTVEHPGSTFLSATVQVAASAMDDVLQCAVCLLKMGCAYDPACIVQLGNSAILYQTSSGNLSASQIPV